MRTIKLLVKDVLRRKNMTCEDYILEGLASYFSYKNIRMMFVKDGIFYSEAVSRKVKKDGVEYAVLNSVKSEDFFEENREYNFTKNITYSITDPLSDSFKNVIPLDRLTHNYTHLAELPESYLEKLDRIYIEIYPALDYLFSNGYIQETLPSDETNYATKIREFLKRELV